MNYKGYVFITGGSRGIGKAVSIKFAREGYFVIFSYNKNKTAALGTIQEIGKNGFFIRMNVAKEDDIKMGFEIVSKKIPYLNVLVNNAGVIYFGSIEKTTLEQWNNIIRINLTGVFLVTKYFLPLLKKAPWASIINIASIAGQTGNVVASAAYCASKAGVIGLTRRLAVELAPSIRVNAIAPSFVETDMVKNFIDTPEKREKIKTLHPLKDIAVPNDIAEAVYFLAAPKSRFITGQVLGINGGRLTC